MVNVGVIGLGSEWESRFRPALRKLRERIAVCAFYDPVANRAGQVAAEWNSAAVDGMLALTERADVRALLLLDAGWAGLETVKLVCQAGKPVYVVSGFIDDRSALDSLHERATGLGQTIMPAFGFRYTPATCRLRELMATCLGRATAIRVDVGLPMIDGVAAVVALADWCRYVVGTSPARVKAAADVNMVRLEFAPDGNDVGLVQAELQFASPLPLNANGCRIATEIAFNSQVQAVVVCERGTATLNSATQIDWQQGDESVSETLTAERAETEVMLDLFCRRVVGGLIPVADISDVLRGARLMESLRESGESREFVEV